MGDRHTNCALLSLSFKTWAMDCIGTFHQQNTQLLVVIYGLFEYQSSKIFIITELASFQGARVAGFQSSIVGLLTRTRLILI